MAPPAVAAEVDAGALRARTGDQRWARSFADRAGHTALAEHPGAGPSGRLGFQTAASWFHATRIVDQRRDGGAFEGTLATTDPLGRRLAVRVQRDAAGVIA